VDVVGIVPALGLYNIYIVMPLTILAIRIKSRAILLLKPDLIDELRPIMTIKFASISYVQIKVQIVLK
jgi:hypothetical protein